jgi:hypothetical protein
VGTDINGVDARELFGHLLRQGGAGDGQLRRAHDLPPGGHALDEIDQEEGAVERVAAAAVPARARGQHAAAVGGLHQREFLVACERALIGGGGRVAAQHQPFGLVAQAQRHHPRFARGAARQRRQRLDGGGGAGLRLDERFQAGAQVLCGHESDPPV